MDKRELLPPGKHPIDPRADIDPIAGHLERIKTNLVWIDQYRLNYERLRETDPRAAENELGYLRDATEKALQHMQRVTELFLAGCALDPKKRIPTNLELPSKGDG